MMNTPPNDAALVKRAEQPMQPAAADHAIIPPGDEPNSAVLAVADEYINKYRPLWQALAK